MTETQPNNISEIFNRLVQEAQAANVPVDKNKIIIALSVEGGIDVPSAVREYTKLARTSGISAGTKERTERVNEMLSEVDITQPEVRREMIQQIADTFDVSEATAASHIRNYAEDNNIDLPVPQRTSLEDMVAFVKERLEVYKDDEGARAKVVTDLQNEMGYTANSAASAYSRATRELGLATGRTTTQVPLSELVSFMRERKLLSRKQMVEAMVQELGYAESTAGSFYTYINFAREWSKQDAAELAGTQVSKEPSTRKGGHAG